MKFNKNLINIERDNDYNFDRSKFLRLDRNERVIPYEKKDLLKVRKIINDYFLQAYPSYKIDLLRKIYVKNKLHKKKNYDVTITPGADIAIRYIFELFTDNKNKKILSINPTYGMVNIYADIFRFKVKKINEKDLKEFSNKKNYENIQFVYLANPNNPSGENIKTETLLKILNICIEKKILFVLDEVYIDYSSQKSFLNEIKNKINHILILRSFSKSIGLAGLRVGYVIGSKKNIRIFNSIRPPHDTSYLSIKIANSLYDGEKKYLQKIKKSKKFVIEFCKKNKLNYKMTNANFFHLYFNKVKIKKIFFKLKKNKILVKSNYLGNLVKTEQSIRITLGNKEQMKFFFDNLMKAL